MQFLWMQSLWWFSFALECTKNRSLLFSKSVLTLNVSESSNEEYDYDEQKFTVLDENTLILFQSDCNDSDFDKFEKICHQHFNLFPILLHLINGHSTVAKLNNAMNLSVY